VLHAIAPAVPLASVQTMGQRMELPLWPYRTAAGFFVTCGTLALLLAMVGLFGVTYFTVRQRTREFGIRIAVGAAPRNVIWQVLREGLQLTIPGALLGLALAAIAARISARMLVGVGAWDPLSFAGAAAVECLVALAACMLPARRATQVDPIVALRDE
jgi:ABC-type antimicrobial peptide transport system permease subunit